MHGETLKLSEFSFL